MPTAEGSYSSAEGSPSRRLIVFARAPVPGQAKTRLIPALGDTSAAQLHARLVEHTVAKACAAVLRLNTQSTNERRLAGWSVEIACAPDTMHPLFRELSARFGATLVPQAGDDLGARMHHALGRAAPAILFGCDCPALRPADLVASAAALDDGNEAVLGPAVDGGYYLIGTRRSDLALFEGVDWGTGRVIAQTRERLLSLQLRWHELPTYPDIDRPEDLVHLPDALSTDIHRI